MGDKLVQSALGSQYEVDEGIFRKISLPLGYTPFVLSVCAGYYAGALIGQSLRFPNSHLSLLWPPTAIVLAALLLAPPRRWWIFLLAVAPVHILVQLKDGVPALGIFSQLVGNFGQALVAAISVRYFVKGQLQLDSERLWKQAMMQKRMYENEFRVRTRDGSYRHFHVQAVPIVALDSRVHEWVGAAVDITERKEAALEAQRHRDELAHVARVTTMGELAAPPWRTS